jgi:hypothetical protein
LTLIPAVDENERLMMTANNVAALVEKYILLLLLSRMCWSEVRAMVAAEKL